MERVAFPLTVRWESTNRCNLRCLHCYVRAGDGSQNYKAELSKNEMFSIIRQLQGLGVIAFQVEGGEPLIRRDMLKILAYSRKNMPVVTLESNGALINKKVALQLRQSEVNECVISLDGDSPVFHDLFRGEHGAFDRAVNAIVLLQNVNVPVSVRTVVTSRNKSRIEHIVRLLIDLGVRRWLLTRFFPAGRGLNNLHLLPTPLEVERVVEKCLALQKRLSKRIKISLDETFPRFGENSPSIVGTMLNMMKYCPAGQTICEITAEGNVIPCPYLRDFVFGNVKQRSFREIWESKDFELLAGNGVIEDCRFCEYYRETCIGGCRAASYYNRASLLGPDTSGCSILFNRMLRMS